MIESLQYPIGRFTHDGEITEELRVTWIKDIEKLPSQLTAALHGLNESQLQTPYRPEGWTVQQVAHHLADSHLNSFVRFKLALTEDNPVIKPYFEEKWALLADTVQAPVELSTTFISALHQRWVYLLQSMTNEDFSRTFYHPESSKVYRLDQVLGIYSWHGRHHVRHITSLRERMGWN